MASSRLPATMRAAQWTTVTTTLEKSIRVNPTAPLPQKSTSTPLPALHTLVRVAYASINPIDHKLPETPLLGRLMFRRPATPGLDFAGTVVASAVEGLVPGTRVFGHLAYPAGGALAEYVLLDGSSTRVCPLPDGVSLRDAGVVGTGAGAAYQALVPYLKPGDKVLINGASGGVGTFAIQIAKAIGCRVTAVCSGSSASLVKSLGADDVIDYRQGNVAAQLKQLGRQYDHILDAIFHDTSLFYQAHHYLKQGGVYLNIAGDISLSGARNVLTAFILPSWLGGGHRKLVMLSAKATVEDYAQIARWMAEGKLKAVVEEEFALEHVGAAYEKLKLGRTKGKLSIKVDSQE